MVSWWKNLQPDKAVMGTHRQTSLVDLRYSLVSEGVLLTCTYLGCGGGEAPPPWTAEATVVHRMAELLLPPPT